jgi:DNA-binding GntR family transcriptional regulator
MHQTLSRRYLLMAVQYRSAAELAAEEIRHRIHSGQLASGAKVSIGDLASDMALSSTPVREALKVLEGEGLVSIAPRSGVYVRKISVEEVAEVYAIKAALEPLMVRWAILRGTDDQLRTVVGFAAQLAAYARSQELDEYVRVVEERRQLLLTMAASDVLVSLFQTIDGRVRLLRYRNLAQPEHMHRSVREHQVMAQAIADRDVDRACALTVESVHAAARSLLRLVGADDEADVLAARRPAWSLVEELMKEAREFGAAPVPEARRSAGAGPAEEARDLPAAPLSPSSPKG